MIAPAFRRRLTTPASSGTIDLSRANEPAVVFIPSEATVAMLSLRRICKDEDEDGDSKVKRSENITGIPWSGPLAPVNFRSLSKEAASARALGLVSRMARRAGPCKLTSSIRAKYA